MKLVIGMFCLVSGVVAFASLKQEKGSEMIPNERTSLTTTQRRAPVLVELFTSEGCSSCPPADDVLSKLVKADVIPGVEVIALGEHVDYWNHLGWTDPYSNPSFSQRQREYSQVFNLDSIYTPQMIVDGLEQFVGSDWNHVRTSILTAAKSQTRQIDLALSKDTDPDHNASVVKINVQAMDLAGSSGDEKAEVVLAVTENNLQTQVARGENSGRQLRHNAVVRSLNVVGEVAATDRSFVTERSISLSPGWNRENLSAVAFIQERHSHRVLAVGKISLKTKN